MFRVPRITNYKISTRHCSTWNKPVEQKKLKDKSQRPVTLESWCFNHGRYRKSESIFSRFDWLQPEQSPLRFVSQQVDKTIWPHSHIA